jgi:hypothetical protein
MRAYGLLPRGSAGGDERRRHVHRPRLFTSWRCPSASHRPASGWPFSFPMPPQPGHTGSLPPSRLPVWPCPWLPGRCSWPCHACSPEYPPFPRGVTRHQRGLRSASQDRSAQTNPQAGPVLARVPTRVISGPGMAHQRGRRYRGWVWVERSSPLVSGLVNVGWHAWYPYPWSRGPSAKPPC